MERYLIPLSFFRNAALLGLAMLVFFFAIFAEHVFWYLLIFTLGLLIGKNLRA